MLPDPGILEDVQRALKLKARREARLKALQSNPLPPDLHSRPDVSPEASLSIQSSPVRPSLPTIFSSTTGTTMTTSNESEIDFRPSVGTVPLHPVPTSSNDGATLDWSHFVVPDDKPEHRRWSISLSKGKAREKPANQSNKVVVEKQDSLYAAKLSQIKSTAKASTIRKAAITSDQLKRRYDVAYASLASGTPPLKLTDVVKWFEKQDPAMKMWLEQEEPLTWLKHLVDGRDENRPSRFPWHVTALILQEYVKSQHPLSVDQTLEQSPISGEGSGSLQSGTNPYPTFLPSPPFSQYSLEPSLSRKLSSDGYVSFEPFVGPGRHYAIGDSRQSGEGPLRTWRNSLPAGIDSARSSLSSLVSGSIHLNQAPSPSSSRLGIRDIAKRIRRRPYESDEALSSARNSLSEGHIREEDGVPSRKASKPAHHPKLLGIRTRAESGTDGEGLEDVKPLDTLGSSGEALQTAKPLASSDVEEAVAPVRPRPTLQRSGTEPFSRRLIVLPHRSGRISLTSREPSASPEEQYHRDNAEDEKVRYEYELKAQTLEDAVAQNARIRQLLQRVASGVRDYDVLRSQLSSLVGLRQKHLPSELIEAFSHDPAAVTGSTRRLKGWRAVEDVHNRIAVQQEILHSFVSKNENGVSLSPACIFDDPIAGLRQSLDRLERYHQDVVLSARTVGELLGKVKIIHGDVKKKYNDTLAHTSVVYPELSHIVALEESYKDNYQQLWDFGMDALTLLLDSVTPFWRNYGKVIGEDLQDFLIIPWYRNEFTGEPKRYPVKRLPRRSLRHWLGLTVFLNISIAVTVLQARAAMFSLSFFRLSGITHSGLWWMALPFFWTGVMIQWMAVLIEVCIVGAQGAVAVWWLGWMVKVFS
ncbi:hypothetical protein JAAARDRAFT_374068 [Jaapia argillacea MUCL 33604]|uniref:Uncharacterized protein n=1 Tax=Jaapia argillacea MUCL 33604 TaxID=933084 RepID=A0A067Q8D4_9AGAM|nr:hypothetical protein JAAARDRAFT_374068 [Jaapia argillacea MUCL 33604]